MKYAQFRTTGRLGCPGDYEAFHAELEPLLERVHRGTRHAGKVPARYRRQLHATRLDQLHVDLQQAVREERYEEAARLRDQIKELGSPDEPR